MSDNHEIGLARWSDPDTSHEAAKQVPVSKLERLFLDALEHHGPELTTTDIANVYSMDRDTFSPRAKRLVEKGLIYCVGKRPCKNSAGKMSPMQAYRLTSRRPAT